MFIKGLDDSETSSDDEKMESKLKRDSKIDRVSKSIRGSKTNICKQSIFKKLGEKIYSPSLF